MAGCRFRIALRVLAIVVLWSGVAAAQPLGSFRWQLAPYCNVVTLSATQDGAIYTLDGYDDQCGSGARASATGMAFFNPNGSIGIGLTIVSAPGGTPVHIEVALNPATLSGSWSDNHGNSGAFLFSPGAPASGSLRPLGSGEIPAGSITGEKLADGAVTGATIADGSIGAQDIDPGQVQQRIQTACPSGQLMTGVNQNGTVVCEAVSSGAGGDITEVVAGTGLSGGGITGNVTLNVQFSGTGASMVAARSDHTHGVGGVTGANTVVGQDSYGGVNSGVHTNNTALGFRAIFAGGLRNTAVGSRALDADGATADNAAFGHEALAAATAGTSFNTAAGSGALASLASGQNNVAVGFAALNDVATGTGNIAIGSRAGTSLTTGSNNIYVGHLGGSNEDDTIRVGGTTHTRAFAGGIRGVTTFNNNAVAVVIDSAGQLGTVSSSRRTKLDIEDIAAPATSAIQQLRPVQFRYRQAFADGSTPIQFGLIAEEVEEVLPELVAYDAGGVPETVKYHVLPSLLLADVQRLERERQRLERDLARGAARVADLERRLDAQARIVDQLRAASNRATPR